MTDLVKERLRQLASNHSAAFDAMWCRLENLAMRVGAGFSAEAQHWLSKEELKAVLSGSGSVLTSPMDCGEIFTEFESTSAIGRNWKTDIASEHLSNLAVNELLEAIKTKPGAVLLTGIPGSGKTCVMLEVQDRLEETSKETNELAPLFIQSREFVNIVTEEDRKAHGLSGDLVKKVARLAEITHVVVMIDSLDVLSIAREHSVLTYFLSLIDRLVIIPNVTVVSACRDFDRNYDLRIAQRDWEVEVSCQPFDWDFQVEPLLSRLKIDVSMIDPTTRELIRNPRELALFVDLALQKGSFNVVTSQALAERYLSTFVEQDDFLGDSALHAIEEMASEMLKLRTLTLPQQKLTTSRAVKRALLSNSILHEVQDGQLTFGHQTLLDVLVISNAIRKGLSLNNFIKGLPPVPFVRPSIRSFVMQLASKDRVEFRKQIRAVLSGNSAFHIRRLVAETFSEFAPLDADWPLLRDLRRQHNDVFQVIYTNASRPEWHHFWLKHLVPLLKSLNDVDGLNTHAHRIAEWKNDDALGVLDFWSEILDKDGVDHERLAMSVASLITQFDESNVALCGPLLTRLLEFPQKQHSFLGRAMARLVNAGGLDDTVLWDYIAGEVSDEDVVGVCFSKNLRCHPHEFGSKTKSFLTDRMIASTKLLDLAITSVERWSRAKAQRYCDTNKHFSIGFLNETSYEDCHSQKDTRHIDSERILFDAIESAVLYHAQIRSAWWANNRVRLINSLEGALRYFAILGCTEAAYENRDLIVRILSHREWFEHSFFYEIGSLLNRVSPYLESDSLQKIQTTLLSLSAESVANSPQQREWIILEYAQPALGIPCHLRTKEMQAVIDECEKLRWPFERGPRIQSRGGIVRAPFSFVEFLNVSDHGVLRLLGHYENYERGFDDFLIGGKREVGSQLCEAASRHPSRFIRLLSESWASIPACFRDDLMEGVAAYLNYKKGDLNSSNDWSPVETPDAVDITKKIIGELVTHPEYWHHNRTAAKAIEGSAFVVTDNKDSETLLHLASQFSTLKEEHSVSESPSDLITAGINMSKGHIANALMVLAVQHKEKGIPGPGLLPDSLRLFAGDPSPAVRSILLRRMPYFQSLDAKVGWELFRIIIEDPAPSLWGVAEPCLYHAYHQNFDRIENSLNELRREGKGKDLEVWGRISALAAFAGKINFSSFLIQLNDLGSTDAWSGAASVWSHSDNFSRYRDQCLTGLEDGLNSESHCALVVALKLRSLLTKKEPLAIVPIDLLKRCLLLLETKGEPGRNDIFGIDEWLGATSLIDPIYALEAAELYFKFVQNTKTHLYDLDGCSTKLLTRFFAHAEELEESDGGETLRRVIGLQDLLLKLGVNGVDDWLKAAERSMFQ